MPFEGELDAVVRGQGLVQPEGAPCPYCFGSGKWPGLSVLCKGVDHHSICEIGAISLSIADGARFMDIQDQLYNGRPEGIGAVVDICDMFVAPDGSVGGSGGDVL